MDARDGRLLALVNPRVATGVAAPVGSLAKLVVAVAALDAGLVDGARRFRCNGKFERWRCWQVHGEQTLETAIAHSCSSAFFALGRELGARRMNRAFTAAGFGRSTQSGLPGEAAGRFTPARTPAEVTELAYGDTLALQATPLQVASWMTAIAHGGSRGHEGVRAGMRRAVLKGSARAADVPGLAIHGKTGTATQARAPHRRHGWFAGFTERLVVVVFVKEGTGFEAAAPVAREVFAAWSGS